MKKCLIVVDYQNDFVEGALGFNDALKIELNIGNKINEYRQKNSDIIFTFDTHEDNYLETQEGKLLPIKHCIKNTDGHLLYNNIANLKKLSDVCFYKNTFGSSELYEFLKATKYESIELVGVVTNICVISNAILAKTAQTETPIYVDRNCVASNEPYLNECALSVMASLQIHII